MRVFVEIGGDEPTVTTKEQVHAQQRNLVVKDRVFLLSPSGWGNQGDNAILRALSGEITELLPGTSVILATLNPIKSAQGLGYPAVPLRGVQIPDHWVSTFRIARPTSQQPGAKASESSEGEPTRSRPVRALLRRLLPDTVRTVLSRLVRSPGRIMAEARFFFRVLAWLERARAVVVAGGGQLNADWGGDFGQPLSLALWARAARVRRVPFLVLSVGAGRLERAWSRRFIRSALSRAAHVSVRDERTRELVVQITGSRPRLAPDLAFLRTVDDGSRHRSDPGTPLPADEIGVVGISPMAYAKPGSWPVPEPDVYRRICEAMAVAGGTWLRQGAELVLFTTCSMDVATAEEVKERILVLAPEHGSAVRIESPEAPEAVLSVLAEVDVVVAARLHGVILSQIAGKPIIAISHHWKVSEQMSMAEHGELVFEPSTVTASDLTEAMDRIRTRRFTMEKDLRRFAADSGDAVRADVRKALVPLGRVPLQPGGLESLSRPRRRRLPDDVA